MAVTSRPPGPAAVPLVPAPRTLASPTSQGLVAAAAAVAFAALALAMGSALWFAAPTAALLVGVVLGLQLDLRRTFAGLPGVGAAITTLVVLSVLWGVALGWLRVELPYPIVPLAALVVLGADWWWVERLRPLAVLTGLVLVGSLAGDEGRTVVVAVAWFAVVAAALWSLRRDAAQAVPTPLPLAPSVGADREPGAVRTALAVAGSWLAAALVIALIGLVPTWFRSPDAEGRLGADTPTGFGSGPGGGGGTGGGDIGPGEQDPGFQPGAEGRDVDGDGIPDRDIDGDGILDPDLDGDGVPDLDRDGDGIPDGDAGTAPGAEPGTTPDGVPPGGTVRERADAPPSSTEPDERALPRVLGLVVVVLLAALLAWIAVRAVRQALARRRALAARPWAVRLAERLDVEGARRGRARRRDEPVTRYADALGGDVLRHDALGEVGAAVSAALFGPGPAPAATETWAFGVVDEAVAANPPPRWHDPIRARFGRRRGADGTG